VNAPGFGALPTPILAVGIGVAFVGSAVGQYWHERTATEEIPVELSQYDR